MWRLSPIRVSSCACVRVVNVSVYFSVCYLLNGLVVFFSVKISNLDTIIWKKKSYLLSSLFALCYVPICL